MKREEHQRIKHYKRNVVPLAVSAVIVIIFLAVFLNYRATVGQAANIQVNGQPPTGLINLAEQGGFTYVTLPEGQEISDISTQDFSTVTALGGPASSYRLFLFQQEGSTYKYEIVLLANAQPAPQNFYAADIIIPGETTNLHLNINDAQPDLEISYQDSQITVRNLHFISADKSEITLLDPETDAVHPAIIRPSPGTTFSARVRAVSSTAPAIAVRFNGVPVTTMLPANLAVPANERLADIALTMPTPATANLLEIIATVGTGATAIETRSYYLLSVSNRAYLLQQENFPATLVEFTGASGTAARFQVVLQPVAELQPLAVPCAVNTPISTLFKDLEVERLYTYDKNQVLVWNSDLTIPSDLTLLEPFRGYFVKLKPGAANAVDQLERTIGAACAVQRITTEATPEAAASLTLAPASITLFSLPGVIAQPLTNFIPTGTTVNILECTTSTTCSDVPLNAQLNPGKAYWIHNPNAQAVTLKYQLE